MGRPIELDAPGATHAAVQPSLCIHLYTTVVTYEARVDCGDMFMHVSVHHTMHSAVDKAEVVARGCWARERRDGAQLDLKPLTVSLEDHRLHRALPPMLMLTMPGISSID